MCCFVHIIGFGNCMDSNSAVLASRTSRILPRNVMNNRDLLARRIIKSNEFLCSGSFENVDRFQAIMPARLHLVSI
jgi:hypothetical protein